MTAVIATSPKFYFPGCESGSVDVYVAGTTTRANTWQDRAQATLNQNPVPLNARAECDLWLSSAIRYKFVVKNTLGVTVYTVDNVSGIEPTAATVSQFTVDRFSGTGAQTAFTLSVTPATENNTEVYVSGVYIQKNAYSLAGTTLTFAVAPALGTNNIEVNTLSLVDFTQVSADLLVYTNQAAASATGAAVSATAAAASATGAAASAYAAAASETQAAAIVLGNFTQGGTGAVSRTFSAKVREVQVHIEDFGAVGNGTTNDSAAMSAALVYLDSIGGGALYFGPKTYRLNSTVIPVMTAGTIQTMKPLRFVGAGNHWSGNGLPINGGTVLDLRGGDANGKIQLNGSGFFKSSGITYTNLGTADTFPFIKTTNTTVDIRGNAFIGHSTKSGTSCDQDAIVLGGTTTPEGNTANSPFQGYGAIIEGNYFDRVRRQVYLQNWCNGSVVKNNTSWTHCGSNLAGGAAIEIAGDPAGTNVNVGNIIEGNLLEMGSYPYGIKLSKAVQNMIAFNSGYDPTGTYLAMVRLESDAGNNLIITTFGPPGVYVSDAGVGNRIISTGDDDTKLKALTLTSLLTTVAVSMKPTSTGTTGIDPVGTSGGGALWYLKSGTTDANPDASAIRRQWNGDGSEVQGGNGAGNLTNNLASGVSQWSNGRYRGFNRTTGANCGVDTGSGGSFWDVIAFSERHYDQSNTLRYTTKQSGNGMELDADLYFNAPGKSIRLKEGTNAKMGQTGLTAGSATVSTNVVTVNSRIFLSRAGTSGTAGHLSTTISAGSGFTINSSSGTDTSTVNWLIIEPS